MTNEKLCLPEKIPSYLKQLEILYQKQHNKVYHYIIRNSSVYVRKEVEYDNWNGGTYGHFVVLFVDVDTFSQLATITQKQEVSSKIKDDLNACASSINNEFITSVEIEISSENDPEYKKSINYFNNPIINPDNLKIWKSGQFKLFISHRDKHKAKAHQLADLLEKYEISSFVAHDSIEPDDIWRDTIIKALQTMDAILLFITDDFFKSPWTNQEIGYALARGVTIIRLKLENIDPLGFVADRQAIRGDINDMKAVAKEMIATLSEKTTKRDFFRAGIINSLINAKNYFSANDAVKELNTLGTLTENEIGKIAEAFSKNDQLYTCWLVRNKLPAILSEMTGKKYSISGIKIEKQV